MVGECGVGSLECVQGRTVWSRQLEMCSWEGTVE
jgi:hypothetical protein